MCEENSNKSKDSNSESLDCHENQDSKQFSNVSLFKNSELDDESQIQKCDELSKHSSSQMSDTKDSDQTEKNISSEYQMSESTVHQNSLINYPRSSQLNRSCAICLEDYPDDNLSFHPSCECILCNNCFEVSIFQKHSSSYSFVLLILFSFEMFCLFEAF